MTTPAIVLGGTGYVAGELLRLLAGHPFLRPEAVLSDSQAGGTVEAAFPHLTGCFPDLAFSGRDEMARLIGEREKAAILCAVPEHLAETLAGHVGHPGCFVTATLLAAVPLLKLGLVEPRLSVVAVTGSTGAGRKPTDTTHHPARRSNLFAYSPLTHRHEPEMRALAAAASGVEAEIFFTPQSGPFARGIYATLQGRLIRPMEAEEVRQALAGFYAGAPFVEVLADPPRLQDVVGTNRARMSAAVSEDHVVVFSAIDNLVKGAAGGAIQWMNRLLGFPETSGLTGPGLGWL